MLVSNARGFASISSVCGARAQDVYSPSPYVCVCILPFLITRATGTLDDTSTSSDGGGEILEKAIRRSVLSQAVQVETSCAGGVETSCAVGVQATS